MRRIIAFVIALQLVAPPAVSTTFQATLTGLGSGDFAFDRAVLTFVPAPGAMGDLSEDELTELTFAAYAGPSVIFVDVAIARGAAQPLAGIPRQTSDLVFRQRGNRLGFDNFFLQDPAIAPDMGLGNLAGTSTGEVRLTYFDSSGAARSAGFEAARLETVVVPLLPAGPLMAGAIGLLALARQLRRATL